MVDHYSGKPPLTAHAFGYIVAALSSTNRPPIDLEGATGDQRILPRCARFVTVVPVRNHAGQLLNCEHDVVFALLRDLIDELERRPPQSPTNRPPTGPRPTSPHPPDTLPRKIDLPWRSPHHHPTTQ